MELRDIRGIGSVYESKLREAGIEKAEDLIMKDLKEISEKTGINISRLEKWREEARKKIGYKKAEVAEDISKEAFIEIKGERVRVKIKNVWHENVPLYIGNFDEVKGKIEKEEIAVYSGNKTMLWFNGKWYENIPVSKERKKKGFLEKIKEWLSK